MEVPTNALANDRDAAVANAARKNVTYTHPDYDALLPMWTLIRDVRSGNDAIKGKGSEYLPVLPGMSNAPVPNGTTEYDAYRQRADWYGATKRTILGMLGMIFRLELEWDGMTPAGEELMKDVTGRAQPLNSYAKQVTDEVITVTRHGILVDVQEEESPLAMPYCVSYTAEQITNWKKTVIDGKEVSTLVVLRQDSVDDDPESFSQTSADQYLVLRLRQFPATELAPEQQIYIQEFWEQVTDEKSKETSWQIVKTVTPLRRGNPLNRIPFEFINLTDTLQRPQEPILYDLAQMNISHYRTSADLEHAAHFTACPTPWASGVDKTTVLKIGSSTAWILEKPEAKCGIMEFTGQGLQALETRLDKKEAQMARMGASLMEEQKKAAEAAETKAMRQAEDSSVLMSVVDTVSQALTRVVNIMIDWMNGVDGVSDAKVELNKDLFATEMTPQQLDAIVRAFQANTISYETFFYLLKKGGLTRPDVEADEELDMIEEMRGAPLGTPTPEEQAFLDQADPNADPNADPTEKPDLVAA